MTKARAPKWAKVSIFPRRDAHAAVTSANNNIIYRIYIYSTIILLKRRRDKPPARGHTSETAFTPTPWEESMSSQYFAFSQNPAIPPYYIKTPHCMAPRRWRILHLETYRLHDSRKCPEKETYIESTNFQIDHEANHDTILVCSKKEG